jgi:hypothetical protein
LVQVREKRLVKIKPAVITESMGNCRGKIACQIIGTLCHFEREILYAMHPDCAGVMPDAEDFSLRSK